MRQVQVGCVLRRDAVAAPPDRAALFAQVVKPGLPDLLGGQVERVWTVLQGAHHDEGHDKVVIWLEDFARGLEIPLHLAQVVTDGLVAPAFKGAPEMHADALAKPPGVDTIVVVRGNWRNTSPGHICSTSLLL